MILVSPLLDSYFQTRLKNSSYRRNVYDKALRKELRSSKLGHIILRNLGDAMAANPAYHKEFATWYGEENYQKNFWESDLGYLWYQGNLHSQNNYFDFAMEEIRKNKLQSLLDVGCGWGRFCNEAAKLGLSKVKGIDISEDIIKNAKDNFSGSGVVFECKDIIEEKDHYDLVTLFGSTDYIPPSVYEKVLEHILTHADKEIIIVNSLRGIPLEKAKELEVAIEVKRYDDGFLQPTGRLLKKLQNKYSFTFEMNKFGADSLMTVINKN